MAENPFVDIILHNQSGVEVIPIEKSQLSSQSKMQSGFLTNGSYRLIYSQPDRRERHYALGEFLDAWSRLEQQIARAIARTVGIEWTQASVLMNGLGNRGQMETIKALLPARLDANGTTELFALCERIKVNNTKRNYLIHGYWLLEVVVKDRNGVPHANFREYRRYDPGDPRVTELLDLRTDKKARKTYMFSIARIRTITSEVRRLTADLRAFLTRQLKDSPHQTIDLPIGGGVTC